MRVGVLAVKLFRGWPIMHVSADAFTRVTSVAPSYITSSILISIFNLFPHSFLQLHQHPKMPVTEFALLPLTHALTQENPSLPPSLITKLKTAKTVLETASKYTFHYFQQIEDPSIIYIIGKWDSPAAHGIFLPSPENQRLLEMLKDDIESEDPKRKMSMWHLDSDVFKIDKGEEWVFDAPVISCNRNFVAKEKKEGFEKKFREVKYLLEEYTKPYKVVGGWRIEKESEESEEKEEWVFFSGFESVDHHMGFAKMEGFAKYGGIVDFVDGFEVRHLKKVEGL